ncbi:hypothetical protein [Streptomyces sp. NBC_01187]|uniref:hypothetical protein n=1 Tax=Streptomyces sp. NBC_01187 TaxID=2903766 RepID=UPI00386AB199|nr:hypothetical protein OG220_07725 [Streptomyces sp. NBC_01187]
MGAKKAPGGTVLHEPQIDAWYVQERTRALPPRSGAREAVGQEGTSLRACQERVPAGYADKLPGSAYDRKGLAGDFGPNAHPKSGDGARGAGATTAGSGGLAMAAAAGVTWLIRRWRGAAPASAAAAAHAPATSMGTPASTCTPASPRTPAPAARLPVGPRTVP